MEQEKTQAKPATPTAPEVKEKKQKEVNVSIHEALINARKGFKAVKKDAVNPFFKNKYASLASVIEAVEEALLSNGLWFRFEEEPVTLHDNRKVVVDKNRNEESTNRIAIGKINVIIYNKAGEQLVIPHNFVVDELTCQGFGKASTYAQRYALSAALGVVGEDDEDGNPSSFKQQPKQIAAKPATAQAKPVTPAPATSEKPKTLDEIKKIEGITVTDAENGITVTGKTFALSNDLRGLGFHWDGTTKSWIREKKAN